MSLLDNLSEIGTMLLSNSLRQSRPGCHEVNSQFGFMATLKNNWVMWHSNSFVLSLLTRKMHVSILHRINVKKKVKDMSNITISLQ